MAFLAVYGHVNVDYILAVDQLPGRDATVPVRSEMVRLGGTAGNLARAAAALGVPTAIASCVGDDFPPAYREILASAALDLGSLKSVPGPTPKIWIFATPDGGQSAIIDQGVMGDGYARPELDLAMLEATWVHFTTGDPAAWLRVAKDARAARKKVTFDPGQELSYRYDSRLFEGFLDTSDVFFCNESELERSLKLLGYGDPVQLLDHTRAILVTRGAQGVRYLSQDERLEVPACPVRGVDRIDPVGAGDALRGGFFAGLHRELPLPEALRAAVVCASLFLEARNQRYPEWRDVEERRRAWDA